MSDRYSYQEPGSVNVYNCTAPGTGEEPRGEHQRDIERRLLTKTTRARLIISRSIVR